MLPGPLWLLPVLCTDAGLPSDDLRPARRYRAAKGALLGSVLEQRGGHKMILPSLTVLSHGMVTGRATFR